MGRVTHPPAADIEAYLCSHQPKSFLRFITCGGVDDGKSTLIGRLLNESHLIKREQGPIDVAYQFFSTDTRAFIVADPAGYVQYTRNMVTVARRPISLSYSLTHAKGCSRRRVGTVTSSRC